MSVKVELLRRTPHGAPGDIVEVEDDELASYGEEFMVKTKKPLTSETLAEAEKTVEKGEFDSDRTKELDARETALNDKEQELAQKAIELTDKEKALTDKEAELTARETALNDKASDTKSAEVQTGAVTGGKNTAVKTPEAK